MNNFHLVYQPDNNDSLPEAITKISEIKFYFGHQSVGYNIMSGLESINAQADNKLTIIETRDISSVDKPAIIHSSIGENRDPNSKVDDFVNLMEEIAKDSSVIASFKFCYIDILYQNDVDSIFNYYKKNLLDLKQRFPETRIVLMTSPYRAVRKGIKGFVIRLLRRHSGEFENNINRYRFNERLVRELSSEFMVFDLGKIESTKPDGSPCTFKWNGSLYPTIYPGYTYDRGHLNELGKQVVATNLIYFLSNELE